VSTHTKCWLAHRLSTVGRWWQFPGSVVGVVTFGGWKEHEGGLCTLSQSQCRSQDPSKVQKRVFKKIVMFWSSFAQTCRPLLFIGPDGS